MPIVGYHNWYYGPSPNDLARIGDTLVAIQRLQNTGAWICDIIWRCFARGMALLRECSLMLWQMTADARVEGTVTALAPPSPDAITAHIRSVTSYTTATYPTPGVPVMLPSPRTQATVSVLFCFLFALFSRGGSCFYSFFSFYLAPTSSNRWGGCQSIPFGLPSSQPR